MTNKTFRYLAILIMLAMVSLACLSSSKEEKKDEPAEKPATTAKETPAQEEPEAPKDTPKSEDEAYYVYDEGGFKFKPIQDWEITCAIGIIQMKAPDAHPEYGPAFMIMAGDNDTEMTTEEAFEKFKRETTAATLSEPKKVKVGGFQALQADMTVTQGDEEVKATVVTSMLTAKRQFTMMASSPTGRYEADVAPYFDDVLKSVIFISPKPDAGCPGESGGSADEPGDEPTAEEPAGDEPSSSSGGSGGGELRQWASKARASSQYSNPEWSASQATGEPDVFECGDSVKAWASEGANTKEWIELTYDVPVVPTQVTIHQNYNPSQVYQVDMIDVNGSAYTIAKPKIEEVPYCPDAYEINLELEKQIYVNKIKVYIDQRKLGLGWNEIDAVELVGYPQGGSKPSGGGGASKPSGGGSSSKYAPEDLDPGSFAYSVSGYEDAEILGARLQYQKLSKEYMVMLVSNDDRYGASFYLPREGLKKGVIKFKKFEPYASSKAPTAGLVINTFPYGAQDGELVITKDPSGGKLTGTFTFHGVSKDFPDREVSVSGAMNEVPLEE